MHNFFTQGVGTTALIEPLNPQTGNTSALETERGDPLLIFCVSVFACALRVVGGIRRFRGCAGCYTCHHRPLQNQTMFISASIEFRFKDAPAHMYVLREDGYCWGRIIDATGAQWDLHSQRDYYDEPDEDAANAFIRRSHIRRLIEPALIPLNVRGPGSR